MALTHATVKRQRRRRLGAHVRGLRQSAGMSQKELARGLRCDQRQVSRIERGETAMTVDTLYDVARALGYPPEAVLQTLVA